MIGSGKCGVFQLESITGMKNFMKELKPKSLGRYHCRNLPVPSGSDGFYPSVYQRKNAGSDYL